MPRSASAGRRGERAGEGGRAEGERVGVQQLAEEFPGDAGERVAPAGPARRPARAGTARAADVLLAAEVGAALVVPVTGIGIHPVDHVAADAVDVRVLD